MSPPRRSTPASGVAPGEVEKRTGSQAVERALQLLRCFETGPETRTLGELATLTGFAPSTTHRLLRALCDTAFLRQDAATERYGLGVALVALGGRASRALGFEAVRHVLEALGSATGESVNLGVRDGEDVLVLSCVPSSQRLRFDQEEGSRVPVYASAMGKALLAFDPDPAGVIRSLPRLAKLTGSTITSRAALTAVLDEVRERGWALNDEEREPGVRTVAMPVLDAEGHAVVAIAVQGPSTRMTDQRIERILSALRAGADEAAVQLASPRDATTEGTA